MAHRLRVIAAQITASLEEPLELPPGQPWDIWTKLKIRSLTRADDEGTSIDGPRRKGFQRVKLPPKAASVVPTALRRWQAEAAVDEQRATMEAQRAIYRAFAEGMREAILRRNPKEMTVSWDNDHTLRVYLVALGSIIRQSNVLSGGVTPGENTANGPHTDMVPLAVEEATRRKVAERRGCSVDEVTILRSRTDYEVMHARALGVSPEAVSDEELARYVREGLLQTTTMWMSPDHSAMPLAFLDHNGADYSAFKVHALETGEGVGGVNFDKPYDISAFPSESKLGQLQFTYKYCPDHQWCYFEDLAEDEAVIFLGLDLTFHTAFSKPGHVPKVERVSCEVRPLCLVVDTRAESSMSRAATFLSAVRDRQRNLVFGNVDGKRDVDAALSFLKQLVAAS